MNITSLTTNAEPENVTAARLELQHASADLQFAGGLRDRSPFVATAANHAERAVQLLSAQNGYERALEEARAAAGSLSSYDKSGWRALAYARTSLNLALDDIDYPNQPPIVGNGAVH